jgi:hypothetical protein
MTEINKTNVLSNTRTMMKLRLNEQVLIAYNFSFQQKKMSALN